MKKIHNIPDRDRDASLRKGSDKHHPETPADKTNKPDDNVQENPGTQNTG